MYELKKRNTAPEAACFQVLFYLKVLKEKGIETTGIIRYQENNRVENVELTPENEARLEQTSALIMEIINKEGPPEAKRIKYCRNCSYYELCFI